MDSNNCLNQEQVKVRLCNISDDYHNYCDHVAPDRKVYAQTLPECGDLYNSQKEFVSQFGPTKVRLIQHNVQNTTNFCLGAASRQFVSSCTHSYL